MMSGKFEKVLGMAIVALMVSSSTVLAVVVFGVRFNFKQALLGMT